MIRAGAVSIGPSHGERETIFEEAAAAVHAVARDGARLVVLPELFSAPYFAGDDPIRWRHVAEALHGPTCRWASRTADAAGTAILFSFAYDDGGAKPINAAVLARPADEPELVGAKIHLPPARSSDRFGEADHFEAGPAQIESFEFDGLRIAPLICYDRRFPECWRHAAASGADLVCVLVAGPAPGEPDGYFLSEMRTHARSNGVYALSAARYGLETLTGHAVCHDGITCAIGPGGEVLATVPMGHAGQVIVDVEPALAARARRECATASRLRLGPPPVFQQRRGMPCPI